jgi:hypothetical protein
MELKAGIEMNRSTYNNAQKTPTKSEKTMDSSSFHDATILSDPKITNLCQSMMLFFHNVPKYRAYYSAFISHYFYVMIIKE